MTSTPIWLLDIDGVINAATRKPPTHAWPADDWIDTRTTPGKGRSWRILAARPVLDYIRSVHESGTAEIRWHTTWQHDAQQVADALKLPTFAVQEAPEYLDAERHLDEWWKLPAALRVLAEGRRLVWTDDDAVDLTTTQMHQLNEAGALVVSPAVETGLCRSHLRKIETFLMKAGQR